MAKKKQGYFIVNPSGTIHEVTKEIAQMRLGQLGYRQATKEEVDLYMEANGNQRHDAPLCPKFDPTPKLTVIELEEEEQGALGDILGSGKTVEE